jgi:hypothetical protein
VQPNLGTHTSPDPFESLLSMQNPEEAYAQYRIGGRRHRVKPCDYFAACHSTPLAQIHKAYTGIKGTMPAPNGREKAEMGLQKDQRCIYHNASS